MEHTTAYTLRIDGHLDPHWSARLADLAITHNADGTSTLHGPITDQAQLHGVLASLRDLGAVLIDLEAIDPAPSTREGLDRLDRVRSRHGARTEPSTPE